MIPSRDIFISHSSNNRDIAETLVKHLESEAVSCWIAPRDIRPGFDYGDEIVSGIANSTIMLVLFSADSNKSQHVLREVDRALKFDKVIVPIRIDDTAPTGSMDYYLCTVQWVDRGFNPLSRENIEHVLSILKAAKGRDFTAQPEYILLNVCSRCGAQYAEHDPSGCSFHPDPPEVVGNTGPLRDYADVWRFPCCGQKYVGTFNTIGNATYDSPVPKSPGCVTGRHTPKYIFSYR
jgi:hypothetical protein